MKKVIILSTVLGLSALGMACGEGSNTNVTVKPANTVVNAATPAAVNTVTPAANVTAPNANAPKANTTAPNANAPKANTAAPSPTKKP